MLDGQQVSVAHSILDINEIDHAFDGDPTTLIRTLEANPLKIVLSYPEPVQFQSATLLIGGPPTRVTVTALLAGEELTSLSEEVGQSPVTRELTLAFDEQLTVDEIRIEVLSVHDGEVSHVHSLGSHAAVDHNSQLAPPFPPLRCRSTKEQKV